MSTLVIALYEDLQQAREVVEELIEAGVSQEKISLTATDPDGACMGDLQPHELEPAPASAAATHEGAGTRGGAVVGGLAGALLSLGAYVVPGARPLLAMGPVLALLGGAAAGAAAGAIVTALVDWGIPKEEADRYAEAVRRGCVLVAVTTSPEEAATASRIMDQFDIVDLERRSAYWRTEGWTALDPDADYYTREQIDEEQAHYTIYETYEPIFRTHFETHLGRNGRGFHDYATAYYAGYILGADMRYRNHSWEELEPEARRRWQSEHSLSLPWDEVHQAIRYAWKEVREDYYGEENHG
jgi:hypothetical protein